ncbi:MAG TPA: DUF6777 domain-containing protein [Acidimicrobiia bacterium]|nr:DUF6777 domain-containing protein [Acidimicrobiia bacterium]
MRRIILFITFAAVLLAACGGGSKLEAESASSTKGVLREPAESTGPQPFTTVAKGAAVEVPETPRDALVQVGTSPGIYGGSGSQRVCEPEALVAFLESHPAEGRAWAGVVGIQPDRIADYVATLTPLVLLHDTRVTNHGYANGHATPRQSVLQAGTAVLVDRFGVPRARCACGNPLLEPDVTADGAEHGPSWGDAETAGAIVPGRPDGPLPTVDVDTGEPTPAAPVDFCTTWVSVEPDIAGGPSGPGDIEAYLTRLADGLSQLVAAAEATPGFPLDALADLVAYRDAVAIADASTPGDTALRDRVEDFLDTYCSDDPGATDPEAGDDPVAVPDEPANDGNCGSLQFFLLIEAAESLGLDWEPVAQPFLDALDALDALDGSDLSVILDFEEIGCDGAEALQQLFIDAGFGDVIEDTPLA